MVEHVKRTVSPDRTQRGFDFPGNSGINAPSEATEDRSEHRPGPGIPADLTDASTQRADPPEGHAGDRPPRRASGDLADPRPQRADDTVETVALPRENPPVATIPAQEDLTESSVNIGRIAWSITTLALLIAVVVLVIRGDIGYAGVTLAVAIAAGINLF